MTILENENNANHNFSMDEDNVVIIQNDLGLSNKIPTSTNEQLNDSFAGKKIQKIQLKQINQSKK